MSLKQKKIIFGAMLSTILVNYYTLSFFLNKTNYFWSYVAHNSRESYILFESEHDTYTAKMTVPEYSHKRLAEPLIIIPDLQHFIVFKLGLSDSIFLNS
jgi:hypothetical protein